MANKAPTPLSVLIKAMHLKLRKGKQQEAAALARLAAPYVDAMTPAHQGPMDLKALTDDQIYDLFAQLTAASAKRSQV